MAKAPADCIYQLKVTLAGARPPVWRRLLVSSSATLRDFHDIVQIAMGWMDCHFHQYEVKGQLYRRPSVELELPMKDETRTRLAEVLRRPKDSMLYEYDFGDSWIHQVVLEKIVAPSPGLNVPQCIAGARACPPEDCGGIFGYAELLKALKDPSHPEHDDMLQWVGEDYDPNIFDLEAVNERLAPRKGGR
jgi:hypothetical protein